MQVFPPFFSGLLAVLQASSCMSSSEAGPKVFSRLALFEEIRILSDNVELHLLLLFLNL